jgi:predicted  nucleic acid-binding Zn-ribbon protein
MQLGTFMPAECTTSLLILQDRDMNLQRIERELVELPVERAAVRKKVEDLETQIEAGKQRVREVEVHGKSLETEMAEVEEQVLRYRSQQLLVKKNEEYKALTHEIETAQGKVSDLEEKEIELLYELDDARKALVKETAEANKHIELEKRSLDRLDEKEVNLNGEIDGAKTALAEVEADMSKQSMSIYRRVSRGLKFPIIVAQRTGTCQACHMKVSAAVEVEVRKGNEITTCDNCGRILYCDA